MLTAVYVAVCLTANAAFCLFATVSFSALMRFTGAFIDRTAYRTLLPVLGVVLVGYCVIVRLNGSYVTANTVGVAGVVKLVISLSAFIDRTADRALLPMLGIVLVGYCVIVRLYGSYVTASTVGVAGVVKLVISLSAFIDRTADRALLPMLGVVLVGYCVIVRLYGSYVAASTVGIARVVKLVISLSAFIYRTAYRTLFPMLGIVLIGCCVIVSRNGSYLSALVTGCVTGVIVAMGTGSENILALISRSLEECLALAHRVISVSICRSALYCENGILIRILTEENCVVFIRIDELDQRAIGNVEGAAVYNEVKIVSLLVVVCMDHGKCLSLINIEGASVKSDIEYRAVFVVAVLPYGNGSYSVCGNGEGSSLEGERKYLGSGVILLSAADHLSVAGQSRGAVRYKITALDDDIRVNDIRSALIAYCLSPDIQERLTAYRGEAVIAKINNKSSADVREITVIHISASHRVVAAHKDLNGSAVSEITDEQLSCLPERTW